MRLLLRLIAIALCVSVLAVPGQAQEFTAPGRVVAFGDVHGAYDDWVALLRELGVIDNQNNWSGGNAHLVSVGDLIDRGPGSRQVVELLMQLEQQAQAAGGAVHLTLGNHEVMVLTGDLRYVSPQEFASFADMETAAEREALFAEYRRFNPDVDASALRAEFDRKVPPGFIGLKKAYAPDGHLGKWLIRQPLVVKVNDKAYMHGGIASANSTETIGSLNEKAASDLKGYLDALEALEAAGVMPRFVPFHERLDFLNARAEEFAAANPKERAEWFTPLQVLFDAQEYFLFGQDSPNWYRGSSLCHPYSEAFNTERFLKKVGASQLVVGHTPTSGDVVQRMGGRVIRLDTGMLKSVYKGRASALVSAGGETWVHYLGTGRAEPRAEQRSLSQSTASMSDGALEAFMERGEIVNVQDIGTGITKPKRVTLSANGEQRDAVFKYEDTNPGIESRSSYNRRRNDKSDRFIYDVAAYKLDRMLDLQLVPVSVLRKVRGDEGALGDWLTGTINERDRMEDEVPFNSYCKKNEQYRLRFIFDILIYNEDRNLTNILWTKDDFMMRFIDHTLAFRTRDDRPKQYRKVPILLSDLFAEQLQALNEENLTTQLGPYLHPKQIEAIVERRDLIFKEAQRTGE